MAKQTSSRPSSTTQKQKPTPTNEAPAKAKQVVAKAAPGSATPAKTEVGVSAAASHSAPSHEQIARRAYELYQTRAYAEGNALHDWLRAESDLRVS